MLFGLPTPPTSEPRVRPSEPVRINDLPTPPSTEPRATEREVAEALGAGIATPTRTRPSARRSIRTRIETQRDGHAPSEAGVDSSQRCEHSPAGNGDPASSRPADLSRQGSSERRFGSDAQSTEQGLELSQNGNASRSNHSESQPNILQATEVSEPPAVQPTNDVEDNSPATMAWSHESQASTQRDSSRSWITIARTQESPDDVEPPVNLEQHRRPSQSETGMSNHGTTGVGPSATATAELISRALEAQDAADAVRRESSASANGLDDALHAPHSRSLETRTPVFGYADILMPFEPASNAGSSQPVLGGYDTDTSFITDRLCHTSTAAIPIIDDTSVEPPPRAASGYVQTVTTENARLCKPQRGRGTRFLGNMWSKSSAGIAACFSNLTQSRSRRRSMMQQC
ncbi:MAG: hypothetical protein Q9162_005232 [Coniocarpon cinnabarinum]